MPKGGTAGLYDMFNFVRNYLFSEWLYPFTFPPTMQVSSSCSTSLPGLRIIHFCFMCLFFSHRNRYIVVYHCVFVLIFDFKIIVDSHQS